MSKTGSFTRPTAERPKGRQDYLGDRNHFCDIAVLAAPHSFRALVARETGLSINPRQQALV